MEKTSRPRALIFSTSYFPLVGGAEIAIKELTDRMDGYEFEMITSNEGGVLKEEKVGNVLVHRVGPRGKTGKVLLPFFGTIKTFSILRKRKINLFWGVMVTFASGVPYIVNIKRKIFGYKKIPIVLTLQEGDSEEHIKNRWFGMIGRSWKFALPRTDHLTVISNYLADLSRRYGYRGKIDLIPNGVTVDNFSTESLGREEVAHESSTPEDKNFKKELGFEENDFVLVTTSRLVEKNAPGDTISSLPYLPDNFKFLQLGIGELEDDMRKLAQDLGVADRVKFAGFIDNDLLPKYLSISDVFVRPSLSEGQGISFIEALSFGLPIIAPPVGGIPDFLKDGETGLFCEVKNPKSIAEKVKLLADNKKLREKLIRNGKKLVRENYDWNIITPKMEEVFAKFLN